MDVARTQEIVEQTWEASVLPALHQYIGLPNQSPAFDPEWQKAPHTDAAVGLVARWMQSQDVPGLRLDVVRLEGRTPLIFAEVPGSGPRAAETVLLYGHLDKQPPMEPWAEGLSPWKPVMRGGRLYGRGSADDGYAAFAAVTALRALATQKVAHARCVVIIEASEESGSPDLPAYIDHLAGRLGSPTLVVCLDSGCGDYERLWTTTSLRGLLSGNLSVEVLSEGVHSGDASGIVPSSFRIARMLLQRLEDLETGRILPAGFHVDIPEQRRREAVRQSELVGKAAYEKYPFKGGTTPISRDVPELLLNRTWRPQLEITGADGFPPLGTAGNVLRPRSALKISLRLPPRLAPDAAIALLKELLEKDPPYGAVVQFQAEQAAPGWDAPALQPWLDASIRRASQEFFGKEPATMGEGGTIPFMGMLGEKFPAAQFVITGVLGPGSNAHGPNEFLDVPTAKRLSGCVARILTDHAAR